MATGITQMLSHGELIHPDNEALFEGALLMLLLLSSPEKGENPVLAAGKRQWPLNNTLFEIKKSYGGCHRENKQGGCFIRS